MHLSKLYCFAAATLLTPALAHATPTNPIRFQIESQERAAGDTFWGSFWDILAGKKPRAADLSITVKDADGRPLAGAMVLVGQAKGDPFAGNLGTTDQRGQVFFTHEALRKGRALTVTASSRGFSTLSVLANTDASLEVQLQELPEENDFAFFRGKVTGFPPGLDGGTMELGIFMPAFRPESLLNFDPQQFISSYKVKVDVYGQRDIPGNVVLPTQKKHWGLIPISISKPDFIMPLPRGIESHMAAIVGGAPISKSVNAIQNKDFLAALNFASLSHVGWTTRRVSVNGDETFDVAAQFPLTQAALSAQLNSVPAKLDAVAVSMIDPSGDRGDFVAMDVKSIKAEELKSGRGAIKLSNLKQARPADNIYVFAGLFDRNTIQGGASRSIVGALQKLRPNRASAPFVGFLNPIQFVGVSADQRDYRFTSAANTTAGIAPNLMIFNIVSEKKNAATQGVSRKVLWSAILRGNTDRIELPNLGAAVLPAPDSAKDERFSWEIIAIRSGARSSPMNFQSELRNLQHVSSLQQKF